MKKFLMGIGFAFLVLMQNCWAQEIKTEVKMERRLEVFRCAGLQRFNADVWLRFEHFTDDPLKIGTFYVLPRGLEIKIRDDKKMGTSLEYDSVQLVRPNVAGKAVLLVPDKATFDGWKNFLADLYEDFTFKKVLEFETEVENLHVEFRNGVGVVLILNTESSVPKCGQIDELGGGHVIEVRIKIENIVIKKESADSVKKNDFIVRIEMPWGLAMAHNDFEHPEQYGVSRLIIDSGFLLEIYTHSEKDFGKWQKKLDEWKNLSKPHPVLPPKW